MASVPLREAPVVLAAAAQKTVPLPLPELPEVIVIQPALLTAVQGQPPGAVTATLPVSAAGLSTALEGTME